MPRARLLKNAPFYTRGSQRPVLNSWLPKTNVASKDERGESDRASERERESDRARDKREGGRTEGSTNPAHRHTRENERGREGERGREREERESKDTRRGRRTEGPALSTDLRKALSAAARVCPGPSPGRRPAQRPAPPGDRGGRPAQAAVSAGAGRAGRWHTWRSSSGLCRCCDWRSRYAPQPGRARPSAAASVPRRPLPRRSSVATRPFLAGSRKEEGSSAQRSPRHLRHAGSHEGSSAQRSPRQARRLASAQRSPRHLHRAGSHEGSSAQRSPQHLRHRRGAAPARVRRGCPPRRRS